MAGALNVLAKLKTALEPGGKEARRLMELIGEQFYTAADETPAMFQRGRKYALTDDGLSQQFGVRIDRDMGTAESGLPRPQSPGAGYFYDSNLAAKGPASMFSVDYPEMVKGGWGADNLNKDEIGEYFDPNTRFAEIDAFNLKSPRGEGGGGAGRGVYAAMYGSLLQDPRLVNYTSALSKRNEHRRSYNQSAALLRDPRLAKQILADTYQLPTNPDYRRPVRFRQLTPEGQVGLLQSEGALELMKRIGATARSADLYPGVREKLYDITTRVLPQSEDPADFALAADALRRSGAPAHLYDTIGASALRKAALVNDVVGGRPMRRSLLEGLEYRVGGRVA